MMLMTCNFQPASTFLVTLARYKRSSCFGAGGVK